LRIEASSPITAVRTAECPTSTPRFNVRAAPAQHRHVFGERLKLPVYAGAQRVEVHTLDDCQVPHDHVAQRHRRGHDAEAAIAYDRGCDPERGRRRQGRVPGDLRVVMRVQVDDARHQRELAGIDDLGSVLAQIADLGDAAVSHRKIGADRVVPEPVHHGGAADHEVMHCHLLCCLGNDSSMAMTSALMSSSIEDVRFVLRETDAGRIMSTCMGRCV
jgi:hypothetical protein